MICDRTKKALWAGTHFVGMHDHIRLCLTCQAELQLIESISSDMLSSPIPAPTRSLVPDAAIIRDVVRKNRRKSTRVKSLTALAATAAVACVAALVMMMRTTPQTSVSPSSFPITGSPLKTPVALQTYHGKTFTANILLVRDPKRIKVGVTKYLGKTGETVADIVHDANALGGVNGGAFQNVGSNGPAGMPLGITIHNGHVVNGKSFNQSEIGFTNAGQLICGTFNLSQLKALHVTEAVSFGPVLVQHGRGLIQGDGGWGYAPRTAIGQRQDGTVIFIVTDGRMRSGPDDLGVSLKELQDLMLSSGAVTAANLDGGSSSTMVYQGKLVNKPADVFGARSVATAFVISRK